MKRYLLFLAIVIGLACSCICRAQATQPVHIQKITVDFRDGTTYSTTKPAWRTVITRTDGTSSHTVFLGAAPQEPTTKPIIADGRRVAGVKDTLFDVSGPEGTAAVRVTGANVRVENIEQRGSGMLLELRGATNLVADGLKAVSGKLTDKGIYSGGGINDGVTLRNVELVIPAGAEHGIRFHGWRNFDLANVRVVYLNSAYKGAALTVKEGEGFVCRDSRFDGPVGFEVLPVHFGRPGYETLRCKNILIERCEINTPGYLTFNSGVESVEVRDSTIRAVKWPAPGATSYDVLTPSGDVLDLKGERGVWPAPSGRFVNCRLEGTRLTTGASKANLHRWKFVNCTMNGRPLTEAGEVLR